MKYDRTRFITAYHGCDRSVGEKVLAGEIKLEAGDSHYGMLGKGVYFWENDFELAMKTIKLIKKLSPNRKHKINEPFVIGCVIDPGNCLDLTSSDGWAVLKDPEIIAAARCLTKLPIPDDFHIGFGRDIQTRIKHAALLDAFYSKLKRDNGREIDTLRGTLAPVMCRRIGKYECTEKCLIEFCVRNTTCIKKAFQATG